MRKRSFISIILVLVLILGVVGCQEDDEIKDPSEDNVVEEDNKEEIEYRPVVGGTMTVPITYVRTLNPLLNNDLSLYYFNKLIFEGLFEFDEDLNVKPQLVKNFKIESNGRKIVIELKENVLWHDGEPFNSEDVEFTINTLKYGASESVYREMMSNIYKPSNPEDLRHILDVEVIDEYNLEILFDRSYGNSLESLIFPIIPKHKFDDGNSSLNKQYQKALTVKEYEPIGTGPYMFKNYQELKSIKLESNENWWNGDLYIQSIEGKVLSDKELAITSFETKKVDIAIPIGIDWEKYSQNKNINIHEFISQNYVFLGFNFRNELFQGENGKALRKAIAYGINREGVINKLYLGHAKKVDVPIPPESWLIYDETNTYNFNVGKARGILEAAGWKDTNEDGIYEDEEGKNLSLRLLVNSYNYLRREEANMVSEYLKDIGIEVVKDYNTNSNKEVTEKMAEEQWNEVVNKLYEGDFDMTLMEWKLSYIPDLAFAFHSDEIETGTNIIAYKNETMDTLITDAFKGTSREEKKEAYEKLQRFLLEELPYVSLYFKNSALLVSSKIRGDINPKSFNIYYNIEDWYILREPIESEE